MSKCVERPVIVTDITGKEKEYPTATDAAKETVCVKSEITRCLKGKLKSTKGYRFRYADQEPPQSIYLWSFNNSELDKQILQLVLDGKKPSKRSLGLMPKYYYFLHLLIEGERKQQPEVTINTNVFSTAICDVWRTTSKIITDFIDLGVVYISRVHNQELEQSTVYRLTEAYQRKLHKQIRFDVNQGTMITNLLEGKWKENKGKLNDSVQRRKEAAAKKKTKQVEPAVESAPTSTEFTKEDAYVKLKAWVKLREEEGKSTKGWDQRTIKSNLLMTLGDYTPTAGWGEKLKPFLDDFINEHLLIKKKWKDPDEDYELEDLECVQMGTL